MPPLLWPLVSFATGLALSPALDTRYSYAVIPLIVLLAVLHRRLVLIALCLWGAALGNARSPNPPVLEDDRTPRRVTARLVTPPAAQGSAVYFFADILTVGGVPNRVGQVRLAWFPDESGTAEGFDDLGLGRGDRIALLVELRRPTGYRTPGVFDYRQHLERQGVYWIGTIRSPRLIEVLERGWHGADRLRQGVTERIARYFPDPTARGLVLGMVLGQRHSLPAEDDARFEQAGLIHMLVVSGFNLAVIAAVALRLGRILPTGRYRRTGRGALALALILGYAALVDGGAPVIRATIMASVLVVGTALDRGYSVGNALCLTAFVMLLLDPSELEDPSFQLSFGAVLAILAVGGPLASMAFRRLRLVLRNLGTGEADYHLADEVVDTRIALRLRAEYRGVPATWLSRPLLALCLLGEVAIITACIQVCLLPFAVESFHRLSPVSIPLNVIGAVVAGVVTPLGLTLIPTPRFAGDLIAWILTMTLEVLVNSVDLALSLPGATMRVPSAPTELWVAFALSLIFVARAAEHSRPAIATTAFSATLLIVVTMALGDFSPSPPESPVLTFLDVGQGDSTLVELPDGRRILVDGGGIVGSAPLTERRFRIGEDVVSAYLFSRRIRRIDVVVLTHAHHDHLDGLFDVIDNFEIGEAWLGPNPMIPRYRQFLEALQERNIPIRHVRAGDSLVPFSVLNPSRGGAVRGSVRNDDSVVLLLGWGGRSALLAGDLESALETVPVRVDVLKVPHHGSAGTRLEAQGVPIISVGAHNRFGHPGRNRLPALRTDLLGTIEVSLPPGGLRVAFPALR